MEGNVAVHMYVPLEEEPGPDHWHHPSYLRIGVCLTAGPVKKKKEKGKQGKEETTLLRALGQKVPPGNQLVWLYLHQ